METNSNIKKVIPKEVGIVEKNNTSNSVAKEAVFEVVKEITPIAIGAFKKKIEIDLETQKLLRDDKRQILNRRSETLMTLIEKMEMDDNYSQERIDKWNIELKEIMEEQDVMSLKSEGFTKGLLLTFKEFINSKYTK
jgi:hypothetical protein